MSPGGLNGRGERSEPEPAAWKQWEGGEGMWARAGRCLQTVGTEGARREPCLCAGAWAWWRVACVPPLEREPGFGLGPHSHAVRWDQVSAGAAACTASPAPSPGGPCPAVTVTVHTGHFASSSRGPALLRPPLLLFSFSFPSLSQPPNFGIGRGITVEKPSCHRQPDRVCCGSLGQVGSFI